MAARELFQVVKDHNNADVQDMLDVANVYAYQNVHDDENDDEILPTHFPTVPCALVVVNNDRFEQTLQEAAARLASDGLVVDLENSRHHDRGPDNAVDLYNTDVTSVIQKVQRTMELCEHVLYRGYIYARPEGAQFTYVRLMAVSGYLHKLLANPCLQEGLMQKFQQVEKFLSHPSCAIIHQLEFNFDLIEVSDGYCFSVQRRGFLPCPIEQCMRGKISPRAYVTYYPSCPPNPCYFREGIEN